MTALVLPPRKATPSQTPARLPLRLPTLRAATEALSLVPRTPSDLGFDAKHFPSWRPQQIEAINTALRDLERIDIVGLDSPVGSGKSLINMAVAKLWRKRQLMRGATAREAAVVILTATKALQDQYRADFGGNVVDMRGMANYPCRGLNERLFTPDIVSRFHSDKRHAATCDMGPCLLKIACPLQNGGCHYFDALRLTKSALDVGSTGAIPVVNYAYWMLGPLGGVGLVIMDEGHLLRNQMDSAAKLEHSDLPALSFEKTKEWAESRLRSLIDKQATIGLEREKNVLSRLIQMQGEWVLDRGLPAEDGHGANGAKGGKGKSPKREITPSWSPVVYYDEGDGLANSGTKFVVTSGTLTEEHVMSFRRAVRCKNLTWALRSYRSTFPVSNRRVILSTAIAESGKGVSVRYGMSQRDKDAHLRHAVDIVEAMDPARRKGIIHAVSYDRATEFHEHLTAIFAVRGIKVPVYFPKRAMDLQRAIASFKAEPKGAIIVSPSLTTGYDFPNDLCRWQLVLKVPYPNTQAPLFKARTRMDEEYGTKIAMETLAQIAGRPSRSVSDWCETYVCDAAMRRAIYRPGLVPRTLKDAFMELKPGAVALQEWIERSKGTRR